ncbi:uclacyanin-3-like isoform X2 [Andrographis paniculata]|uniref:uclacyanin-3-like isoform X2 n=1 Tax=Andrographis paniculata TaxID=175694 RepID=UPI0021E9739D|nr:uclacyanin-3-like isoform X2 [Andrographis paniculata]
MGHNLLLLFLVAPLLFQYSQSATMVVDGVSELKSTHLLIGDSVIFQHKYRHYSLYIFKSQEAFTLCNFTQATLLRDPKSTTSYTWHSSRPGFFYFSFQNGSNEECLQGHKFAFKVSQNPPDGGLPPPPGTHPASGAIAISSPAQPSSREGPPPSPAPALSITTAISPMGPPYNIPIITSNPAVPLPTGEVDTATIRPLPTSGHCHSQQVVEFSAALRALSCVNLLLLAVV